MLRNQDQYRPLADESDEDSRAESKHTTASVQRKFSHLTRQIKQRQANQLEASKDGISYFKPLFLSFDQYDQVDLPDWIKPADVRGDVDVWARNNPSTWVLEPNATTDEQMMSVINTHSVQHPKTKGFGLILATVLTAGIYPAVKSRNIRQGEIHFTENAGRQEILIEPGIQTLASPTHVWKEKKSLQDDYIKLGNITIVRIPEGHIGFAKYKGAAVILLPGRHAYNSDAFHFHQQDIEKSNESVIKFATISIIRITSNQLGLAYKHGNPILLLPGLHVANSGSFEFHAKIDSQNFSLLDSESHEISDPEDAYYKLGSISIMRIHQDQYGCAMQNGNPVLLLPGIHIINSSDFKFIDVKSSDTAHFQFNTIQIIHIKEGQVGLAWDDNKAVILEPGIYNKNSPTFKFVKVENRNTQYIKHGSITLLWVDEGEFAYALHQGKALAFNPGPHRSDDPLFKYVKHANRTDKMIRIGAYTRMRVDTGEIGYVWENGEVTRKLPPQIEPYEFDGPHITCEKQVFKKDEPAPRESTTISQIVVKECEVRAMWKESKLEILEPGVYTIDLAKNKISETAIPLQDQILSLQQVNLTAPGKAPMSVSGQIIYRINDPKALIKEVGVDCLTEKFTTVAEAAFKTQLSLKDFQKSPNHLEDKADKDPADRIQDKLKKTVSKWGVEILSVNITDIHFQNREVEQSLAKVDADLQLQKALNGLQIEKEKAAVNKVKTQAGRLFTPVSSADAPLTNNVPLASATSMQRL